MSIQNQDKNIGATVVDLKTGQGFTPGPWNVKESKVPGYARNVNVVAGDLLVCEVTGGGVSNPVVLAQVRANARLLAAAPALYEALTTLLKTETNLGGVSAVTLLDAVDKACAALALVNKPDTNQS